MHLSHKILFGTVLAAVLIVAPLQQSYAQNNTDSSDNSVAAQISHLLELVASLQAQLAELRGHTTTVTEDPTTSERVCPVLSRTLYLGMQGRDVGELQKFLRSTGDYTYPEITNYFGPATQEAVQRWQGRKGIVSSGNPDTTGFGVVGPQTRSVLCGRSIPVVPPKSVAPTSVTSCSTDQYLICATDGGPCRCIPQDGNRSPIVNSFSGPTTLGVNQTGTWTIDASDPENGTLSYDLDWGDFVSEDSVIGQIYAIASSAFRQSNTFQHSYSRAGTYTVTVTVRDNAGNETRTTSTVRVGAEKPSDNVTFSASPTSGSAPLTTTFRAKLPVAGEYALNFGDNTATLTFSVREGACSDGTDHATCGLSLDAARHTYTSPGTYTATLTDPGGCTLAATAQGCLGPPASLLGSVTITVSGSTIDCNAIPSTLGPESLLWKEKCGQPTGTFSASPTSGSAPLSVTFNYQKVSLLYAEEVTWRIYFGDGSSSAWVGSPVSHTYTSPGTYAARITSTPYGPAGSNFTETTLGTVTITVSGGIDCNAIPSTLGPESLLWKEKCGQVPPSVTVVTPRSGQSFSFGDVIPVSWKTSGIPSDAGMSLQLVVRSTGYAIKSQTVKPGAGSASINTGTFCNGYFSDAIDGDCFSLRNGIDKGKTSYFIRAAIYTPADACFGYCARTPGTPETKILAEDESDTFSIISGQSPGTFSASPTSGTAPLSVTFSGLSGNSISFGDGSSAYIIDATYEGITIPHTYTKSGTYVATNNGRSVTITVTGGTQAALPTATIEAGYANTYSKDGLLIGPVGTSVVAWWKSTNAKSCTLTSTSPTKWDGSWTGVGGNILVKIENQRAVYTITCTNADGKKASASVIVSPPPSPEVSLDVQSQMASTLIAVENFLRGLQTVFPR